MSEAFGCGFYPGPDQHRRSNKTDYGNAVRQRFDHPHSGEWQYRKTHDNKAQANASKLRQGDHAPGVDGKLLTDLLGRTSVPQRSAILDVVDGPDTLVKILNLEAHLMRTDAHRGSSGRRLGG